MQEFQIEMKKEDFAEEFRPEDEIFQLKRKSWKKPANSKQNYGNELIPNFSRVTLSQLSQMSVGNKHLLVSSANAALFYWDQIEDITLGIR